MKKVILVPASLAAIIALSIGFTSCKDDDDDGPTKYNLTVKTSTFSVLESDGEFEIEFLLDKPAAQKISIEYEIEGTAVNQASGAPSTYYWDYYIDDEDFDYGEIEFEKGESSVKVAVVPLSDDRAEFDETAKLTVTDADDENVTYAEAIVNMTFKQEDGIGIELSWPKPSGETGNADMDMLAVFGSSAGNWEEDYVTGSVARTTDGQDGDPPSEFIFIPKTYTGSLFGHDFDETTFGLICTYYDGTANPLNFKLIFADFENGDFEDESGWTIRNGTYTDVHKNKWVNSNPPTTVVLTFNLSGTGGEFSDISEITPATEGSRVRSFPISPFKLGPLYSSKLFSTSKAPIAEVIGHQRLLKKK